jgi:AmmeMemoRadiSam system protein A
MENHNENSNLYEIESKYKELAYKYGSLFLALAKSSIENGVKQGKPLSFLIKDFEKELREDGAVFVTINKNGNLRGCIGSPFAHRPLIEDLIDNAYGAAFRDPRFPNVQEDELEDLDISISILTPPVSLCFSSEEDLLSQIRPNVDGLILEDFGKRGLFLPIVWEQLPDKKSFLAHLKNKAGLPINHWSNTLKVKRFTAIYVS